MIITVMQEDGGTVVHWYANTGDTPTEELARASAQRVMYLAETPKDIIRDAGYAHETLKENPTTDLSAMATHVRDGVWFKPVGEVKSSD